MGQVHGANALQRYCHAQPILIDRFGLNREQVWYPYATETLAQLEKAVAFLWGNRWMRWLMG